MFIIDFFYFIILFLILPFMPKYLFNKDYRLLLKKRLNPTIIPKKDSNRLWIHAVSVGEVKSLKKLIEEINKIKNVEIILSVTTPTGYNIAKTDYTSIKVIMAPIDFSFTIKKFIRNIKPDILILNELELWPNWISIMYKKNIPVLLINGRISEIAMGKYKKFKFILKYFFKKINSFLVQGKIYKDRFIELGTDPEKIKICGNIKADEAINSKNQLINKTEILKHLKIKTKNSIITCASTHSSDEKIILPAIFQSYEKHSFIIVPRHPDRIPEISKELDFMNIKHNIWSKSEEIDLKNKVLIFDSIGYLFKIQSISDLIIMGGTFNKKIGGHNLYEPAILGKNIIGGPNYNNFPDIGEELVNSNIYNIVNTSNEMYEEINKYFRKHKDIQKEAIEIVSNRRGSIECIIKEIQKIIA